MEDKDQIWFYSLFLKIKPRKSYGAFLLENLIDILSIAFIVEKLKAISMNYN